METTEMNMGKKKAIMIKTYSNRTIMKMDTELTRRILFNSIKISKLNKSQNRFSNNSIKASKSKAKRNRNNQR